MLEVGSAIEMTRDAPYKEYGVVAGDIGIINYIASTGKYSINIFGKKNPHKDNDRIYGNHGDFWIPKNYVKEYRFKPGDRVEIISPTSKYKGYYATVYCECHGKGHCSQSVKLFIDGTKYQPSAFHNQYLTLAKTSVKLININNQKGDNNMKLTGFNKVAVIEYNNTLDLHYALYDEDIKVGDDVLVTGKLSSQIRQIKDIITLDEAKKRYEDDIIAEVKCKVDLSAYDQRVKNRIKAAELRKEMDKKIAEMDEMNKYTVYAERNPELAEMLKQYQALA